MAASMIFLGVLVVFVKVTLSLMLFVIVMEALSRLLVVVINEGLLLGFLVSITADRPLIVVSSFICRMIP